LPGLRDAIREYNPDLLITSSYAMRPLLARALAEEELRSRTSMAFCAVALLLASAGLFGLLRRQVVERSREIGVRIALGARPCHVYSLIAKEAGLCVFTGLVGGLVVRAVAAVVEGLSASTPVALAVATALMLLVALLATIGPARRVSMIDPIRALHD
jgi:ABC-type antimicrobial peptide transport system permease subunit